MTILLMIRELVFGKQKYILVQTFISHSLHLRIAMFSEVYSIEHTFFLLNNIKTKILSPITHFNAFFSDSIYIIYTYIYGIPFLFSMYAVQKQNICFHI